MPVREDKNDSEVLLAKECANYLRLKKEESKVKKELGTLNKKIVELFRASDIGSLNGKHLEANLDLGDGLNVIFVQLQEKESVSMNSTVISDFREKIGEEAEMFILKVEQLQPNALANAFDMGLLTVDDVADMTTTKVSHALIVKPAKKKSK